MTHRLFWTVFLTFLLFLTACTTSDPGTEESSQVQESVSGENAISAGQFIMDGVEEMFSLHYMDTNSLWQGASYQDLDFETNSKELLEQFVQVLDGIMLVEDSIKELDGPPDLTTAEEFLNFEFGYGEGVKFFVALPDGTAYLIQDKEIGREYFQYTMVDIGDYKQLRTAIEDIQKRKEDTLDYSLEMLVVPSSFRPESQVVRIIIVNEGGRPVGFDRAFSFERFIDGRWEAVAYRDGTLTSQVLTLVEPGESLIYAIALDRLVDAREEGEYRLTNTFVAGDDTLELTGKYTIDSEAYDIAYPPMPQMSQENQAYYDRYLSVWGFYTPFDEDFNEASYITQFRPYLLYMACFWLDGGDSMQLWETYGADLPAELVETTVSNHFLISPETYRASLPHKTMEDEESEYYNPDKNVYHFPGGYGGGSNSGVVTQAVQEGDLLYLTCDWYGMDDGYVYSHTVTIRLGEGENDFVYIENVTHDQR